MDAESLMAIIDAKDRLILALAEKLAICSEALSRCAERKRPPEQTNQEFNSV